LRRRARRKKKRSRFGGYSHWEETDESFESAHPTRRKICRVQSKKEMKAGNLVYRPGPGITSAGEKEIGGPRPQRRKGVKEVWRRRERERPKGAIPFIKPQEKQRPT